MKGFYLYNEDEPCFDCGESHREILGFYAGSPDKSIMLKLARKQFSHLTDEQFAKQVEVTDWSFHFTGNVYNRHEDWYYTEEFELKEA